MEPRLGTRLNKTHPLSRDFVGCWLMNEGAGDIDFDASGNNNTGTITGATWKAGKYGPCLDFDGNGDYVDTGCDYDISGGGTVVAWVKFDDVSSDHAILALDSTSEFQVWMDTIATLGRLGIAIYDGGWQTDYGVAGSIVPNTWYQISFVYDGSTGRSYLNGVPQGSGLANTLTYHGGQWRFGLSTTGGKDHNGQIDNVMGFSRALTPSEIRSLYADPYQMFQTSTQQAMWASYAEATSSGYMTLNTGYWG